MELTEVVHAGVVDKDIDATTECRACCRFDRIQSFGCRKVRCDISNARALPFDLAGNRRKPVLIAADQQQTGAPPGQVMGKLPTNAAGCPGQQDPHVLELHATALKSGRSDASRSLGNSRKICAYR